MAEAVVVTGRLALAERLASWVGSGDETWGLVFLGAMPSAGELEAAKEASRLCDRVVGVILGTRNREQGTRGVVVAPKMAEICREAGCDVIWVPKEVEGHVKVEVGVDGIDGTLLTQAVMTVLPMLVVAHRREVALIRALRNITGGLGDVFSLRLVG